MYVDFKESIILLVQHPLMHDCPFASMTLEECEKAYFILQTLLDQSLDEEYTLVDYMQLARLQYNLAEIAFLLDSGNEQRINHHYRCALHYLTKGGFDLSMKKWVELVSLRSAD